MITTRLAIESDLDTLLKIMEPYTNIYGVNVIENGARQNHINLIIKSFTDPDWNTVVAVDENNKILGFCVQGIFPSHHKWLLKITYISAPENLNQFNASKIGGVMMDKLVELAEQRGKYEFYYIVRDIGTTRLKMTLSNTKIVAEKYHIYDYLIIPPYTPATEERVIKMLGSLNGKNKKTIIVRHGHLKGLYNHE